MSVMEDFVQHANGGTFLSSVARGQSVLFPCGLASFLCRLRVIK